MKDFTVLDYGTDSSGRTVWMTVYQHDWWETVVGVLGFRPVIIQGAFQERNGGGAKASDGAHDKGGCIDVRTRDLTRTQVDQVVKVTREHGAGSYRRDKTAKHGGMDPHVHITLGSDYPLAPMAQTLWASYVSGGDGLAAGAGRLGSAPDYEWRPNPLVLEPPEEDMALSDDDVKRVAAAILKARIKTDDQPDGRFVDSILQKLYNDAFPAKKG